MQVTVYVHVFVNVSVRERVSVGVRAMLNVHLSVCVRGRVCVNRIMSRVVCKSQSWSLSFDRNFSQN